MGLHKEEMVRERVWIKRVCFKWYLQGSPLSTLGPTYGGSSLERNHVKVNASLAGSVAQLEECLPSLHEALHSIPSHTHASRTLFKYISGVIACLKLRSTKETALQLRAFLRCALQKVPTSPHRKCLNCIDVE